MERIKINIDRKKYITIDYEEYKELVEFYESFNSFTDVCGNTDKKRWYVTLPAKTVETLMNKYHASDYYNELIIRKGWF